MNWETVDNMSAEEFFDVVLLYDKMMHPDDYVPAEEIFKP